MKRFLFIICIMFIFTASNALAESCYLTIVKSGGYDYELVFEFSSVLISQFFEKIEEPPPSGIGRNDCTYKLTIVKGEDVVSTSISGRKLNAYGDSTEEGIEGLQQALLRAVLRSAPDKLDQICKAYKSLLEEDCEKADNNTLNGYWLTEYEEDGDEFQMYLYIDQKLKIALVCELKNEELNDTWTAVIDKNKLIFTADEEDPEDKEEQFQLNLSGDMMIAKGEDTVIWNRVDESSEECK